MSIGNEQQLREKLRKISALFDAAATQGERAAAEAAMGRVKRALAEAGKTERTVEYRFSLPDRWHRRLFTALCRRHGLDPYRYRGQRYNTVMLRVTQSFVDRTLWPEYNELKKALEEFLNTATERIIREEVWGDISDADEMVDLYG